MLMPRKNTNGLNECQRQLWRALSYTPYGYRSGCSKLLAFNGERADPITGHYLLGNGYRGFNPVLMRFNSPDSMSPFETGGLNSYGYCIGDPINFRDPDGHSRLHGGLPRANGAGRLVKAVVSVSKEVYFDSSRPIYGSMRSLTTALPVEVPSNWDLIGYHGSTKAHGPSLKSGLNVRFQGSSYAQRFGEGFYLAPDKKRPLEYAQDLKKKGHESEVYGVYTENFSRLKLGRDYSFRVRESFPMERKYGEIVIREFAYNLIAVRSGKEGRAVVPAKSNEAPF